MKCNELNSESFVVFFLPRTASFDLELILMPPIILFAFTFLLRRQVHEKNDQKNFDSFLNLVVLRNDEKCADMKKAKLRKLHISCFNVRSAIKQVSLISIVVLTGSR